MTTTTNARPELDLDALPPTAHLVLEVLAARHRTGERMWTFPTRLRPVMRDLEARGMVGWKAGVVEGTVLAWLTDTGRAEWLTDDYEPATVTAARDRAEAAEAERDALRRRLDAATRIEFGTIRSLTDALGLDHSTAEGCVPGCPEDEPTTLHYVEHLVADRADRAAEGTRRRRERRRCARAVFRRIVLALLDPPKKAADR